MSEDNKNELVTSKEFRQFTDEKFKEFAKTVLTKEDGKQFTTKKDLEQFATKKDLERYTTVIDFKEFAGFVADNVAMKKDIDASTEKILASNDKLAKKLDTFLTEKTILGGQVQDHEKRINVLEAKAGA